MTRSLAIRDTTLAETISRSLLRSAGEGESCLQQKKRKENYDDWIERKKKKKNCWLVEYNSGHDAGRISLRSLRCGDINYRGENFSRSLDTHSGIYFDFAAAVTYSFFLISRSIVLFSFLFYYTYGVIYFAREIKLTCKNVNL